MSLPPAAGPDSQKPHLPQFCGRCGFFMMMPHYARRFFFPRTKAPMQRITNTA